MKTLCIAIAALLAAGIILPGFGYVRSVARPSADEEWFWVASLSSLPVDGSPMLLPALRTRRDAWNWLPDECVGHFFVRRVPGSDNVVALMALHGRGIKVAYNAERRLFESCCWKMQFTLDGIRLSDDGKDLLFRDPDGMPQVEAVVKNGDVFVQWKIRE